MDVMHYLLERQAWPTFNEAIHRLGYSLARRYWKGDEGQCRLSLLFSVMYASVGLVQVAWVGGTWLAVRSCSLRFRRRGRNFARGIRPTSLAGCPTPFA